MLSKKLIVAAFLIYLVIGSLSGCGGGGSGSSGGGSSSPPPTQTAVSGIVFASDVFTSGSVKAYDFSGGSKGGLLASAFINSTGAYLLSVPGTPGAILIEADSGCYTEKGIIWSSLVNGTPTTSLSTLASVCTGSPSLSAAVPFTLTPLVVAVTPYTHAAVGLAEFEIRSGTATTTALIDANARLSQWIGTDILTTLPTAPVRSSTFSGAALYGSLLSGIPSWLLNTATTAPAVFGAGSLTTLAFADAMKSDLEQDGVLNGTGRDAFGAAVALTVGNSAMTTTIYRHQLAFNAVIRVRGETEGAVNATLAEQASIAGFLPSLLTYNNAVNTLVDASPLVTLDEGGPVVTIGYPSPGAALTGDQGMAGYIHDNVGIPSGNTTLWIDGGLYAPFTSQYLPNHFINTTIFAKGAHVLTMKTVNNLNQVVAASVNVTFY
jgi:hypothetical protein